MPNIVVKINEYDRKLLYELDKNAHLPISTLAKKLKKSKQFINYRLQRLEEEKIIAGYHAIVDMSKLGYTTYRVYFKLQGILEGEEKKLIAFLEKQENIWTIARLHGTWDIAFFIGVKTVTEFHEVWDEFLNQFHEYIKNQHIAIYAPIYNYNREFFITTKNERITRIYGFGTAIDYDELDFKIIQTYCKNIDRPIIEIAKELNVSPNTIINRIKRLEKEKVIIGYKLNMNLAPLGFEGYRVDIHLKSYHERKTLQEYCKQHQYIYQYMDTIGGADFEVAIIAKDFYHLLEIMKDIQSQFAKTVMSYDYFGYSSFVKLSIIPD